MCCVTPRAAELGTNEAWTAIKKRVKDAPGARLEYEVKHRVLEVF